MLASTAPISYRQLPLRLYQIGPKFRDELKARFGLMRAKEFIMKDMYTFDRTEDEARETYELVNEAYTKLFKQLEVPFKKGNYLWCINLYASKDIRQIYNYTMQSKELNCKSTKFY